jgi:radical SAM superfamily enzyme YgiQ (UPF0313 family)
VSNIIKKKKTRIFLGDLAYFNQWSKAMITIPLNVAYVASYLILKFGDEIEVTLFKDPEKLLEEARVNPPDVLGLSCLFWNMRLDMLVFEKMKKINPDCLLVIGGQSIDTDLTEQRALYDLMNKSVDFMVVNEGELGFAQLIGKLLSDGRSNIFEGPIDGCTFFQNKEDLITGQDIGLSLDLELLPSPMLTGLLEEFLTPDYLPLFQTTRTCPYSCAFCTSGRDQAKLRAFPVSVITDEIDYLAKKYQAHPHKLLMLVDDNFGVYKKRDLEVARYLLKSQNTMGYPQQLFCYFDKNISSTMNELAFLIAKMNSGGVQLAFQSFNDNALQAVKRKNMNNDQVVAVVKWARENNFETFAEMIFGLPYETKNTYLEGIEFLMQNKVDNTLSHNMIMLNGIEMNRKQERERFQVQTKYRPTHASEYGMVDGDFVCEGSEIVISTASASQEEFMDVRKISLINYLVSTGYFKQIINFLVDRQEHIMPMFEYIMNPSEKESLSKDYVAYVEDFVEAAESELSDSYDEVRKKLHDKYIRNGSQVTEATRLNPYFSSRMIYSENWFGEVLLNYFEKYKIFEGVEFRIARDLVTISENEWVDLVNPAVSRELVICEETIKYLNYKVEPSQMYILKMETSETQLERLEGYKRQYDVGGDSFYFNALDVIQPRSFLRFKNVSVSPQIEVGV